MNDRRERPRSSGESIFPPGFFNRQRHHRESLQQYHERLTAVKKTVKRYLWGTYSRTPSKAELRAMQKKAQRAKTKEITPAREENNQQQATLS